jgi:oxygen-independent coproporphyrinogen-3 oxidase
MDSFLIEKLFKTFESCLISNPEITIEANPNSISKGWLEDMFKFGVNRVSFGVQSFDSKKLKFLGRRHSAKEALDSVELANVVGFENISIDLIYNTKLDTKELLKKDIDLASKLPINHISSYSLTIEEESKFEGKRFTDERFEEFFISKIKEEFYQYEISNFSRGYKSKHNLGYWSQEEYIGVGSGAVGFYDKKRFYSNRDLKEYIKNPLKKEIESLSDNDLKLEAIFLGLRSEVGVDIKNFNNYELDRVKILINEGKVTQRDERIYNTNYLLSDELALYIS